MQIASVRGEPTSQSGRFKLWMDKGGNIRALEIEAYYSALRRFRSNLGVVQLGGLWKDVTITEKDISEARADLLKRLEESI